MREIPIQLKVALMDMIEDNTYQKYNIKICEQNLF